MWATRFFATAIVLPFLFALFSIALAPTSLLSSEEVALVKLSRLVLKEAALLYSCFVSTDVRFSRLSGTVSWLGLVQGCLHRYLTSPVIFEAAIIVTQIRQQPDKDEKTYSDHLEEYAAECSSAHSDDMLVNHSFQGLLSNTRDTATEVLHRMTIKQSFSLPDVVCFAQAEGQTYRAQTNMYEKAATLRSNRRLVVLIAKSLDRPFASYRTGPPTLLDSELDPLLLMPDTDEMSDV